MLDGEADSEAWRTPAGAPWMLLTVKESGQQSAYAVWVDGQPMLGGVRDRLRRAGGLLGRQQATRPRQPSVAVAVTVQRAEADGGEALRAFLAAQSRRDGLLF